MQINLDEFKVHPDPTTCYGLSCPWPCCGHSSAFIFSIVFLLENYSKYSDYCSCNWLSGEQPLPFGLLVLVNDIKAFSSTSRYLDDLLNIDNPYFEGMVNQMCPPELQLIKANTSDTEPPLFGFASVYF